jgi:predicted GNAT superfamily acetyltransferase
MNRMTDGEPLFVTATDASASEPLGRALLALNNADAAQLSWLEPERLQHLVSQAFVARRIGNLDAFLLALDQNAEYDSPNFQWFRARYEHFVYVDRIVVASSARGRGYARKLYQDLFEHAVRAGHERVFCEVNRSPPNPASDAFHAALGFVEVGTATVYEGRRTVRYLSRALSYAAVAGGSASTE